MPGFEAQAWPAVFAPANTPAPVVARVNRDVAAAAMAAPEVRNRMAELGIKRVGGTPEELRDLVAREIPRMAGARQRDGVRPE